MKQFTLLFLLLAGMYIASQAQSDGIFYQAVARDAAGTLLSQELLQVRFTVNQGASQVYQATQTVTTSKRGLFSAVIGSGDPVSFGAIDWSAAAASLEVEVDDGTGFVSMGVTDFHQVPYSKVATDMEIGALTDVSDAAPANDQVLKWNGTSWAPADDDVGSSGGGPIAFGFVRDDGTIASGSGNFTASWDAGSSRYEIDITGENYFWTSYATNVTSTSNSVHRLRTGSVGGKLLVYFHDSSGALIQSNFQFTTFKP